MKMLNKKHYVIPAFAGIQRNFMEKDWIPVPVFTRTSSAQE
jgi:hypothetical protein